MNPFIIVLIAIGLLTGALLVLRGLLRSPKLNQIIDMTERPEGASALINDAERARQSVTDCQNENERKLTRTKTEIERAEKYLNNES